IDTTPDFEGRKGNVRAGAASVALDEQRDVRGEARVAEEQMRLDVVVVRRFQPSSGVVLEARAEVDVGGRAGVVLRRSHAGRRVADVWVWRTMNRALRGVHESRRRRRVETNGRWKSGAGFKTPRPRDERRRAEAKARERIRLNGAS